MYFIMKLAEILPGDICLKASTFQSSNLRENCLSPFLIGSRADNRYFTFVLKCKYKHL